MRGLNSTLDNDFSFLDHFLNYFEKDSHWYAAVPAYSGESCSMIEFSLVNPFCSNECFFHGDFMHSVAKHVVYSVLDAAICTD